MRELKYFHLLYALVFVFIVFSSQSQIISSFPYYENFENSNGGFTSGGSGSTWAWGTPGKPVMQSAGQGQKCWTNGGLTGTYRKSENSWLLFPEFDFTSLDQPFISFLFFCHIEWGWEEVYLEYSTNNGSTWTKVGSHNYTQDCYHQNWYNHSSGYWSGSVGGCYSGCGSSNICSKWLEARFDLDPVANQPSVRLRFRFGPAGTLCEKEGFGVDAIMISEYPIKFNIIAAEEACEGVKVNFSYTPMEYSKIHYWLFGDGGASTQSNPQHRYLRAGTYNVRLITIDKCNNKDTATKQIIIHPKPRLSLNISNAYCANDSAVKVLPTPAGGHLKIDNQVDSIFDPGKLGIGYHSINYSYTDTNGCANSLSEQVRIDSLIKLDINNLHAQYCTNHPAFKLEGTPSGGVFKINGIVDTFFNPAKLGVGNHTVSYSYNSDCLDTSNSVRIVRIDSAPTVNILNLNNFYCINAGAIPLNGKPAGGAFTINNQAAGSFDPASLGKGNHQVQYSYTDPTTGCTNSDSMPVIVHEPTVLILNLPQGICSNDSILALEGHPSGGTFTIDGSVATQFDPSALTIGQHVVSYFVTDSLGCDGTATSIININQAPVAQIFGLSSKYCKDHEAVTLAGTPVGGNFYIDHIFNNILDPNILDTGIHIVSYTYIDTNTGCFDSTGQQVNIHPLPVVSISGLNQTYCEIDTPVVLSGHPNGGTFTINGNQNTLFNPLNQGAGNHQVKYQFTDPFTGCTNEDSLSITVNGKPNGKLFPHPDTTICYGDDLTLWYSGPEDITWSTGDQTSSILVKPDSTTLYWLNANNCRNFSDSVKVHVSYGPIAGISVDHEKGFAPLTVNVKDSSKNGVKYFWLVEPDDSFYTESFEVTFEDSGFYRIFLIVTDQYGCTDTISKYIFVESNPDFDLPNVFTPNNDDVNDYYHIIGYTKFREFKITIFNRWGMEVFASDDPEFKWDGITNEGEKASEGVYFFIIEALLADGKKTEKTGTVTIFE